MPRGPLSRPAILTAFAIGLALQLVQAWVVGDQRWMAQHTAQFAAGAAVWWLATWGWMRPVLRTIAISLGVFLPVAYVLSANGLVPNLIPAGGWRSSLWWGNPHLFGMMLASTAAGASILITRARWTALLLWAMAGVVTIAIWSRGPTLAVLLGAATWTWTRFGWRGRLRVAAVVTTVLAAAVITEGVAPERMPSLFRDGTGGRFFDGSVVDPNGRGGVFARLGAHAGAWRIIAHSFPSGVGFGSFADVFLEVVAPDARFAPQHAHHQILQLLAEGGLLGLVAWAIPIGAAMWGMARRAWWAVAPFVAVQAYLWGTEAPFLSSSVFYAFWVVGGIVWQVSMGTWKVHPPCDLSGNPSDNAPNP